MVCLCGSTRFEAAYIKAARDETLKGNIVLSVGMFGHQEGIDMNGQVKQDLDDLHLDKIDKSHEVFIINEKAMVCNDCDKIVTRICYAIVSGEISECCGARFTIKPYIGESTAKEIAYAIMTGRQVRYLNPPQE
jgi:hypothetical protein